eukprot:s274_g15.t1
MNRWGQLLLWISSVACDVSDLGQNFFPGDWPGQNNWNKNGLIILTQKIMARLELSRCFSTSKWRWPGASLWACTGRRAKDLEREDKSFFLETSSRWSTGLPETRGKREACPCPNRLL